MNTVAPLNRGVLSFQEALAAVTENDDGLKWTAAKKSDQPGYFCEWPTLKIAGYVGTNDAPVRMNKPTYKSDEEVDEKGNKKKQSAWKGGSIELTYHPEIATAIEAFECQVLDNNPQFSKGGQAFLEEAKNAGEKKKPDVFSKKRKSKAVEEEEATEFKPVSSITRTTDDKIYWKVRVYQQGASVPACEKCGDGVNVYRVAVSDMARCECICIVRVSIRYFHKGTIGIGYTLDRQRNLREIEQDKGEFYNDTAKIVQGDEPESSAALPANIKSTPTAIEESEEEGEDESEEEERPVKKGVKKGKTEAK